MTQHFPRTAWLPHRQFWMASVPYSRLRATLLTARTCDFLGCSSLRRAFTLMELTVALAVTGLALAIVAPSFVIRPLPPDAALQEVINAARRTAARRAQTMTLEVGANGAWSLTAAAEKAALASGKLDSPAVRSFRVRVSPLGMCVPENDSVSARSAPLDPLDCRWREDLDQGVTATR